MNLHSQIKTRTHSSNFGFSPPIPNLTDVQRECFSNFLDHGIKKAFQEALVFETVTQKLEIRFFPDWIQYQKPQFTQKQASILGKTYGSAVYIPVCIKTTNSSSVQMEWLFVGILPLMTKHGHFLINGIPRVVLHQMLRNPGIYTLEPTATQAPCVKIIPQRGGWIDLLMDKKAQVWFSTRALPRKVSILIVLQAVGFSLQEIFARLRHSEVLKHSYVKSLSDSVLKKKKQNQGKLDVDKLSRHDRILLKANLETHPLNQQQALDFLWYHFLEYSSIDRAELTSKLTKEDFFWKRVLNPNQWFLGEIGRRQFHEKLSSPEPLDQYALTAEDLLVATQALLDVVYKERIGDEIDSLTQKRIRGCDEFLLTQLTEGIKEFRTFFSKKINALPPKTVSPSFKTLWRQNKVVFSKFVTKSWKSFFTSGTLAQFMDQTNPLAETTHKRRLTVLGPGGVSSKHTTIQIRGIHPTFYGRLCPIETPEGKNAGLVNSFTVFAKPTETFDGSISTPFYKVYKGQVQKNLPLVSILPQQEESQITTPADLPLSNWNLLPKTSLPVRNELNFDSERANIINLQSVSILQNLSVATSLIPFLEHDDANRALMGSNMQRQAVPLLQPEAALIGTGLETRVLTDVNHTIQAAESGYVTHVNSNFIKILTPSLTRRSSDYASYSTSDEIDLSSPLQEKGRFCGGVTRINLNIGDTSWSYSYSQNEVLGVKNLLDTTSRKEQKESFCDNARNFVFSKKLCFGDCNTVYCAGWNHQNTSLSKLLKSVSTTEDRLKKAFSKNQTWLVASYMIKMRPQEQPFFHKTSFSEMRSKEKLSSPLLPSSLLSSLRTSIETKKQGFDEEKTSQQQKNFHQTTKYRFTQYQRTNQSTLSSQRPILSETSWVEKGEILVDGAASSKGKLAIGKNIIVAYLPWEGYNYEDAIVISQRLVDQDLFTSLHIDHYEIEVKNTQYGLEKITNKLPLKVNETDPESLKMTRLDSNGIIPVGSWVQEGDYLVGKTSPLPPKGPSIETQYEKLYNAIMKREKPRFRNTSLRVPKGVEGFVLDVQILPSRELDVAALVDPNEIVRVRIVLLQRRKVQVGDKIAGRHGNKGIVSAILPRQDMPYLPDGTPVDIVLNPLGVPSRMNVGQLLECLLGLAGHYLHESYTTNLFDEKFGAEASRSLVFSKLYEASIKTKNPWLFEPHHPGKMRLFDGRTGTAFDQPVTVGCAYILKLVHMVDDKIHARATGPYSAVTQQPVRGRSRNGGQRLGEMEVWALQAYGAAHTLHELVTLKSDDIEGRKETMYALYKHQPLPFGKSESFKLLLRELQALCFDLRLAVRPSSAQLVNVPTAIASQKTKKVPPSLNRLSYRDFEKPTGL
jgi:DNA-directed RNA polymerase beta subunit